MAINRAGRPYAASSLSPLSTATFDRAEEKKCLPNRSKGATPSFATPTPGLEWLCTPFASATRSALAGAKRQIRDARALAANQPEVRCAWYSPLPRPFRAPSLGTSLPDEALPAAEAAPRVIEPLEICTRHATRDRRTASRRIRLREKLRAVGLSDLLYGEFFTERAICARKKPTRRDHSAVR